jgi:hypothetical protein
MRCEGYRRYGGAFTLGPVKWEQCKEEATVLITFSNNAGTHVLPGCAKCWAECIENKLNIVSVIPIENITPNTGG